MSEEIVNKIAAAQIEQIDLASFLNKEAILEIDLKEQLWNELVLKEKDFRTWIKEHDWSHNLAGNVKKEVAIDQNKIPNFPQFLILKKKT